MHERITDRETVKVAQSILRARLGHEVTENYARSEMVIGWLNQEKMENDLKERNKPYFPVIQNRGTLFKLLDKIRKL